MPDAVEQAPADDLTAIIDVGRPSQLPSLAAARFKQRIEIDDTGLPGVNEGALAAETLASMKPTMTPLSLIATPTECWNSAGGANSTMPPPG